MAVISPLWGIIVCPLIPRGMKILFTSWDADIRVKSLSPDDNWFEFIKESVFVKQTKDRKYYKGTHRVFWINYSGTLQLSSYNLINYPMMNQRWVSESIWLIILILSRNR